MNCNRAYLHYAPGCVIVSDMGQEKDMEIMLTTSEAAQELGISQRHVARLINTGILSGVKRAKTWFVTREALEQAKRRDTKSGPKFGSKRKNKSEVN